MHKCNRLGRPRPKLHNCSQYNVVLELELEVLEDPIAELGNEHGIILQKLVIIDNLRQIIEVGGNKGDDLMHELLRVAAGAKVVVLEDAVRVDALDQLLLAQVVEQSDAIFIRRSQQLVSHHVHCILFHIACVEEVNEGLKRCMFHIHLHRHWCVHVPHCCEHVLEYFGFAHLVWAHAFSFKSQKTEAIAETRGGANEE